MNLFFTETIYIQSVVAMLIEVLEAPEFEKCLKKMRIGSIYDDVDVFKKAVASEPDTLRGTFRISGLGIDVPVYKAKKFRCRDLCKGTSNFIRLVYAYFKEDGKILLIEIYKKGQQENHNSGLIIKCVNEYMQMKKQKSEDAKAFMK